MSEKPCYKVTLRSVLKRVAQLKLTLYFFDMPLSRDDSMVMVMMMMMMMMMIVLLMAVGRGGDYDQDGSPPSHLRELARSNHQLQKNNGAFANGTVDMVQASHFR